MRKLPGRKLLTLAALAAGSAMPAAAPAVAADQPWGFEQVTPVDKSGSEPVIDKPTRASHDGSALMYSSMAGLSSLNPESAPYSPVYSAVRGPEGWNNRALDVAMDPETPSVANFSTVGAVSEDHTRAVVYSRRALAPGAHQGGLNVYRHDLLTGEYRLIAASADPATYGEAVGMGRSGSGIVVGGTPDFDRIVLQSNTPFTAETGEHEEYRGYIYQWDEDSGLTLESRLDDENGTPMFSAAGVNSSENTGRDPHYLSADGRQLIVVSRRWLNVNDAWLDNPERGLFVRRNGSTVPISYSRLPGDDRTTRTVSNFSVVASADGRFIAFRTTGSERLSPDAPDGSGEGFYLYDRDQPEEDQLRFLAAAAGVGDEIHYPIALAADGRTFYFSSPAVLAPGATTFSDNIYVWRDGQVRMVAKGRGWGPDATMVLSRVNSGYMASPNGRYFAFSASAPVTGEDTTNPTACPPPSASSEPDGWCREAYLYDAVSDTTVCASCAPVGHHSRGHAGMGPAVMATTMYQARPLVTDDGEVYFDTPNPLVAVDGNADRDVYAYRDGKHRLVSRASPATSARFLTMSGDGKSVFIVTNDRLVGQDRDHLDDVYVTRAGAGLASQNPAPPPPACDRADCRGPRSEPPPLPLAGSVTFVGDGNVLSVADRADASVHVTKVKAVVGWSAKVKVRVPGAGRISVAGASVNRSGASTSKAGTYSVTIALSSKAKQTLKKRRTLKVRVRVSYRSTNGRSAATTIAVTFKQPKAKRATSRKGGR